MEQQPSLQAQSSSPALKTHQGGLTFWLDGEVLACSCPDCGSPMSIRLWLMVADCWRCGASVELTEEQEQAVRELLQRARAQGGGSPGRAAGTRPAQPAKARPMAIPVARLAIPQGRPPGSPWRDPVPRRKPSSSPPSATALIQDEWTWLRAVLGDLQAWLISAVLHMVLLILLACLLVPPRIEPPRALVLSTRIGLEDLEGAHGTRPSRIPWSSTTPEPRNRNNRPRNPSRRK